MLDDSVDIHNVLFHDMLMLLTTVRSLSREEKEKERKIEESKQTRTRKRDDFYFYSMIFQCLSEIINDPSKNHEA
jgi:hypothetical protein